MRCYKKNLAYNVIFAVLQSGMHTNILPEIQQNNVIPEVWDRSDEILFPVLHGIAFIKQCMLFKMEILFY